MRIIPFQILKPPLLPHEKIPDAVGRDDYYSLSKEIDRRSISLLRPPKISSRKNLSISGEIQATQQHLLPSQSTRREMKKIALPTELTTRLKPMIEKMPLIINSATRHSRYKGYSENLNQSNCWTQGYHVQPSYTSIFDKKVQPPVLNNSKESMPSFFSK